MTINFAHAIETARVAARLSQLTLGTRMGLKGRGQAICRWEMGHTKPTKRNLDLFVQAIRAVNPAAADAFLATINPPPPPPPVVAPAPLTGGPALERAVFLAADELDLPPRRVRSALLRFIKRMRAGQLTAEAVQPLLEGWIMNDK